MSIFLWRNNTRFGPYPEAEVAAWLLAGNVSYDDLGWRDAGGISPSQPAVWQPLRLLFPPPALTPPAPASPPSLPPAALPSTPAPPPPLPLSATPPPLPTVAVSPPVTASVYLSRAGVRYGPYDEAQLRNWLAAGAVAPDDLAWHAGMNAWEPLRALYPPPAPPPVVEPPSDQPVQVDSVEPSPAPEPAPSPDPAPAPTPAPPQSRAARMGRFLVAAGSQLGAMAASGQLADLAFQAARIVSAWQSGYRPMRPDPNAPIYRPTDPTVTPNSLPSRVDLRAYFTAVEDQGQVMSCTANAVAGAYEYWVKRHTQQDYDVSRLFIYYNARWRNHEQDRDAGSVIQLAMEGLESFGACAERTWPYDTRLVTTRPNSPSFEEATHFKIKEKQLVHQKLDDWRHCLAEGQPIVFGCKLFDSFDSCSQRGGVVPMPNPQDVGRHEHGSHAMCCVGYSDSEQVFIVRNSWGTGWGDQGYCYMPYNYLMNEQLAFKDSWIFVPCEQIPAPQDTWGHNDQPVTNGGQGVSFDTNPRPPSDYADVPPDPNEHAIPEWHDEKPPEFEQYEAHVENGNFDQLENFDVQEMLAQPDVATNDDVTPAEENSTEDQEQPPVQVEEDTAPANDATDDVPQEQETVADDSDGSVSETASEESPVSDEDATATVGDEEENTATDEVPEQAPETEVGNENEDSAAISDAEAEVDPALDNENNSDQVEANNAPVDDEGTVETSEESSQEAEAFDEEPAAPVEEEPIEEEVVVDNTEADSLTANEEPLPEPEASCDNTDPVEPTADENDSPRYT